MRERGLKFSWSLTSLALAWVHGYMAHVSKDNGFWICFSALFVGLAILAFFAQNPEAT